MESGCVLQKTGTWVKVLDNASSTTAEISYTLYDKKYRPVRSYTKNHLGGYTQVDTNMDWAGRTIYTVTKHKRTNADAELVVKDMFTYSPQDKLLVHKQKINALPEQLISSNTYDDLGQLTSKNVGGTDATGAAGLQKVDYKYNIRGWLKEINKVDNLQDDLFAFKINYNDADTATDLFNGNISETYWKTSTDNVKRKYDYKYDDLNRLLQADYSKQGNTAFNSYLEHLWYDKNGNIQTLLRNGDMDTDGFQFANPIDNLTYMYDTNNKNQLLRVFDATANMQGFKDDTNGTSIATEITQAPDYGYDANGNMNRDDNKGIKTISYNHLNLPTRITFVNGNNITYLYNATGQKVNKVVTEKIGTQNIITTTYYLNGYQYVNNILQFFPHAEGYVHATQNGTGFIFNYVYNYTDHLGNIRLSYAYDPNSKPLKIIEENHYYPFGLKHSGYNSDKMMFIKEGANIKIKPETPFLKTSYDYKYNGKEFQDELGLNMYDYGARNYDAAIGRWMNIDPKAETYLSYSSYNYVLNNPNYFVDPNGEDVYLHYFLRNNHKKGKKDTESDNMFWQAAITRGIDFINSGETGSDDILIMKGIDSMDDIKSHVESDVAEYSGTYGKTAEFGLWSHGGTSGPFRNNSNGSEDQLSVSDWGKINFNWSINAKASFYGCRTARPETAEDGKSFVARLSNEKNMKNIEVVGQTHRSYPSPFTDVRQPTNNISQGKHIYPTYMVGSYPSIKHTISLPGLVQDINSLSGSATYAQPMAVYKKGIFIRYEHQSGKKR